MLRITRSKSDPTETVLRIEGRIAADRFGEVVRACEVDLEGGRSIVFDLSGVTWIDRGAATALRRLIAHRSVRVTTASPYVRALLAGEPGLG